MCGMRLGVSVVTIADRAAYPHFPRSSRVSAAAPACPSLPSSSSSLAVWPPTPVRMMRSNWTRWRGRFVEGGCGSCDYVCMPPSSAASCPSELDGAPLHAAWIDAKRLV